MAGRYRNETADGKRLECVARIGPAGVDEAAIPVYELNRESIRSVQEYVFWNTGLGASTRRTRGRGRRGRTGARARVRCRGRPIASLCIGSRLKNNLLLA